MIKRMGIYRIGKKRYIATGIRKGILHQFKDCLDFRVVYYPAKGVIPLYDGNTEVSTEDWR